MPIISVDGLQKSYGPVSAVADLSFEVKEGALFAFLGPNGAGKSTTINILCSILPKDAGSVTIDGLDLDREPARIKEKIGIVFQGSVLDDRLTVRDNLACRAALYGFGRAEIRARVQDVCNALELHDVLGRDYRKLSGGQKRRVDIARALLTRPRVLFLDEPTTGLDPATRQRVWQVISTLRQQGVTIFLTTHYMEETAAADEVVILNHGKIAAQGTPDALKSQYAADTLRLIAPQAPEADALLQKSKYAFTYKNGYCLRVQNSTQALDFLIAHRETFPEFELKRGDMDDVFLNVTGEVLE